MKFIFITNELSEFPDKKNQSTRYRCLYPSLALIDRGHLSTVTTLSNFSRNIDFNYDIYIFHSPINSITAKNVYNKLKKKKN